MFDVFNEASKNQTYFGINTWKLSFDTLSAIVTIYSNVFPFEFKGMFGIILCNFSANHYNFQYFTMYCNRM